MDENETASKSPKMSKVFLFRTIVGSSFAVLLSAFLLLITAQPHCPLGEQKVSGDGAPIGGNCTNTRPPSTYTSTPPPDSPSSTVNDTKIAQNESQTSESVSSVEPPKPPIATFDEWTKEKLRQEHRRTEQLVVNAPSPNGVVNPHRSSSSPSPSANRNYASRECGAKIVTSNDEAENMKAVLNDKEKDEYMRNPCEKAPHKFFVVELCETIQTLTVELANFELFSSGPRDIRISASERFPTNEWTVLAEVVAQDSRNLQKFQITKSVLYAKFLKVELLSHYGKEHYCTLTVLRVLGMSMVDEYEAEAEIAAAGGRITPEVVQVEEPVQPVPVKAATATEQPNGKVVDSTDSPPQVEQAVQLKPIDNDSDKSNDSGFVGRRLFKKIATVFLEKFSPENRKRSNGTNLLELCTKCPINASTLVPHARLCNAMFANILRIKSGPMPLAPERAFKSLHPNRGYMKKERRKRVSYLQRWILKHEEPREECPINSSSAEGSVVDSRCGPTTATIEVVEEVKEDPVVVVPEEVEIPIHTTEIPPTTPVPPTPHKNIETNPDPLPAPSISPKESVFLKLNKRIAALELNMSLSSEYLSELSRQYVAQNEMLERNIERAKHIAEDAVMNATAKINNTLTEQLDTLQKEVEQISNLLARVRSESVSIQLRMGPHQHRQCSDNQRPTEEEPKADVIRAVRPYYSFDDGYWTTEAVVYVVVFSQLFTLFVTISLVLCARSRRQVIVHTRPPTTEELSEMVDRRLAEHRLIVKPEVVIEEASQEEYPVPLTQAAKKRRRRRNKQKTVLDAANGQWDSAVDSSIPTPSATQSDLGSESDRRRDSLDNLAKHALCNGSMNLNGGRIVDPIAS